MRACTWRLLALVLALLSTLASASPPPAPPTASDDPLADIKDPHTLSQLLQWSLANQDLDALHRKAEAIRRGDVPPPADAEADGGVDITGDGMGLPAPTQDGAAAAVEAAVKPLTNERKAELNELYKELMPDQVRLMREALATAQDVSLEAETRENGLLDLAELVEDIDNARDCKTIG